MSLLVVGSIAIDSVETPSGQAHEALGGSASYFSYAASYFCPVRLVGVVGEDFPRTISAPQESTKHRRGRRQDPAGRTFRWRGKYEGDMNVAETLEVELNVFGSFDRTSRTPSAIHPTSFSPTAARRCSARFSIRSNSPSSSLPTP